MALVGVHLAVSVGLADFCADPNQAVSGIISPGSDTNTSCLSAADDACIAAYFINCPPDEASPFSSQFGNASSAVAAVGGSLTTAHFTHHRSFHSTLPPRFVELAWEEHVACGGVWSTRGVRRHVQYTWCANAWRVRFR
jgi:hypothetical protein